MDLNLGADFLEFALIFEACSRGFTTLSYHAPAPNIHARHPIHPSL